MPCSPAFGERNHAWNNPEVNSLARGQNAHHCYWGRLLCDLDNVHDQSLSLLRKTQSLVVQRLNTNHSNKVNLNLERLQPQRVTSIMMHLRHLLLYKTIYHSLLRLLTLMIFSFTPFTWLWQDKTTRDKFRGWIIIKRRKSISNE